MECCELLFDDDLIQYIVEQSIMYARQSGNSTFTITVDELRVVLVIQLLSGYTRLLRRDAYWEQATDVHIDAEAEAISRNRFRECLRFLDLADNEKLDAGDCYAKVRPLFTNLNEKWLLYFSSESLLSVDEWMVNILGRTV